ncbi:MAG: hypothetical protein L7V87_07585, partial [Verrucomicrobiales bacterium]|nr:hypothetical protein [Verrucomicrobiales bacterium]
MRISLLITTGVFFFSNTLQGEESIATQARAILDAYHSENPKPGDRKLHVIYWRPADRDYAADYEARIPRMLEHIQKFYA